MKKTTTIINEDNNKVSLNKNDNIATVLTEAQIRHIKDIDGTQQAIAHYNKTKEKNEEKVVIFIQTKKDEVLDDKIDIRLINPLLNIYYSQTIKFNEYQVVPRYVANYIKELKKMEIVEKKNDSIKAGENFNEIYMNERFLIKIMSIKDFENNVGF